MRSHASSMRHLQSAGVSYFSRDLVERKGWEPGQRPGINNPLPGPEMRTAGFRGAAFPPLAPDGRQTGQIETIWFPAALRPASAGRTMHFITDVRVCQKGRGGERRAVCFLRQRSSKQTPRSLRSALRQSVR